LTVTLQEIIVAAVSENDLGWESTITSNSGAKTVIDAKLTDTGLDDDYGEGAWVWFPEGAAGNEIRRVLSATETSGTLTHGGQDYNPVPVSGDTYVFTELVPAISAPGYGLSWQRAVNRGLQKCWIAKRAYLGAGNPTLGTRTFTLPALDNVDDVRRVYGRRTRLNTATDSGLTLGAELAEGATSATLSAATGLRVGDVLGINDERVLITALSGVTATITRGYEATTDALQADSSPIYVYEYERYDWKRNGRDYEIAKLGDGSYQLTAIGFTPSVYDTVEVVYIDNFAELDEWDDTTECPLTLAWKATLSELFEALNLRHDGKFAKQHRLAMAAFLEERDLHREPDVVRDA
jgi:hypothetical protein